jgi:hypothetical protein
MKIEDGLPLNPLDEPREARVARGVALLDEKRPGWRTQVNPDTLDMASDFNCVLGQLYGRYSDGWRPLDLTSGVQATRYGFDAVPDGAGYRLNWLGRSRSELNALTEAWRAYLGGTHRRTALADAMNDTPPAK